MYVLVAIIYKEFLMIQLPADSVTKNILYFRDYLHIENPKLHGIQKFANVARMIKIKPRVLE